VTQASTRLWNLATPCSIRERDQEDPEKATAGDAEGRRGNHQPKSYRQLFFHHEIREPRERKTEGIHRLRRFPQISHRLPATDS
jgi:hypothetical protein